MPNEISLEVAGLPSKRLRTHPWNSPELNLRSLFSLILRLLKKKTPAKPTITIAAAAATISAIKTQLAPAWVPLGVTVG
jgi:hypothetical protein